MKKKIILIGPAYPYRGGNSLFVSHLYDLLKEKFDVRIYNYSLLYPSFLFPGTTQYDNSATLIKKAPSERLINSINPFNWIRVANRLKKEKADLVIFDWWHPFFAPCHFSISRLIKKVYKNKILFITENYISHEGSPVDKLLTKIGLLNASSFLTLSEKVEKELSESVTTQQVFRAELPIYDCYENDGMENNKEQFGFSPDSKLLLFFGYIRKYKGLDILLKAMPALIRYDEEIRLLVVGESYDDIAVYTSLIKELGIEKQVKLINTFVPNEEVSKYYLPADLVILPYRSATQSGILNVAYGFGKPVLVTDVGGLAAFVDEEKTGLVVQPESPEAIVAGVQRYYELKDQVDFLGHIQAKNKENLFYKIPDMLQQIIEKN